MAPGRAWVLDPNCGWGVVGTEYQPSLLPWRGYRVVNYLGELLSQGPQGHLIGFSWFAWTYFGWWTRREILSELRHQPRENGLSRNWKYLGV